MSRKRSILGALAIAALSCAALVGASSASAAVSSLHECLKNVSGTEKGPFSDPECKTTSKTGEFHTVKLTGKPKLTLTNTGNFVLNSAPLGIQNEITCEEMMSAETTAENTASGFSGEGKTTFSKCVVNKPAGCTVKQPIETVKLKASSEDLESGVMRTKYTPASGTAFVTITLENCGLLNGGHTVTGVARSQTVDTETEEFSSTSGSELSFFGATATLTGKLHTVTAEEPSVRVYRETP